MLGPIAVDVIQAKELKRLLIAARASGTAISVEYCTFSSK